MSQRALLLLYLLGIALSCSSPGIESDEGVRHVKARVQTRLGGPVEETEMAVHQVPVNPQKVAADQAELEDGELVLGVVANGQPVAYPIRYLALYEVVNDSIGSASLAPTW